jgi:hypothetical protein
MIDKQLAENIFKLLLASEIAYYEDDLPAKSAAQQATAMVEFFNVLQPTLNKEELKQMDRLREYLPKHR